MISAEAAFKALEKHGIEFFTGVPDSLLKDFCAYVNDHAQKHVITANEGGAIALASGYHLATRKIACVYMQNSGLGNTVNPLLSLADPEVYKIPMLLIIGWRAEPGVSDEPQHIKQGKVMIKMLDSMEIPWQILPTEEEDALSSIKKACEETKKVNSPYVIIVKKDTFNKYAPLKKTANTYEMTREEAASYLASRLKKYDVIVSTTGKLSRELYETREKAGQVHEKDFLTVGSMGHASQIALGIAMSKPDRKIYCFDGDGAAIMHLGSLAIIGEQKPKNFKHIIFNNGAHESVGGQPTAGFTIDFTAIAKACGYNEIFMASTKKVLEEMAGNFLKSKGPSLLEVRVNLVSRKDLGRPKEKPSENKELFMRYLDESPHT